ncbi:MAG: hypothetical protein BWX71_02175 [Deltaproteobacteria bacterium ADurb.Bin072]|nr:MAG: hypothetical protein BWX71_02175 [Deltaproteobacteria bacterium ADurb.Bin072]
MDRNGSYPMTSMPRPSAALATMVPMAPRPTTPTFLPRISVPPNLDFPFSIRSGTLSPSPTRPLAQAIPSVTFRLASSMPRMTSSFTPLAFAPGVLNTTMPFSEHLSMGMLFTPAPARAMAFRLEGRVMSFISLLRTRMPSGSETPVRYSYLSVKRRKPFSEMLFSRSILYIQSSSLRPTII